jgi:hypothetical protein
MAGERLARPERGTTGLGVETASCPDEGQQLHRRPENLAGTMGRMCENRAAMVTDRERDQARDPDAP